MVGIIKLEIVCRFQTGISFQLIISRSELTVFADTYKTGYTFIPPIVILSVK